MALFSLNDPLVFITAICYKMYIFLLIKTNYIIANQGQDLINKRGGLCEEPV